MLLSFRKIWPAACLLLALWNPVEAAPLLASSSFVGLGDTTNTSLYGGTIGVDDPDAVTTRFVASAFSNGTLLARDLKTFLGFPANPGTFNQGSTITATYLNVQAGDVLEFIQSDVELGLKPDLTFLVTFYDLINDQIYINPLAITPDTLQSILFPGTGDFLVGFSLIQTGGSNAKVTVTTSNLLSSAPELNADWAAVPLAFTVGALLLAHGRRRPLRMT